MNTTESREKGGRSQARMERIHRPRESMPGCFSATNMETAIVSVESGAATIG